MTLHIKHKLDFTYDRPVFIEPMTLRLRPHSDCNQKLIDFSLSITPAPTGQTQIIDLHNNVVTTTWFNGKHEKLTIEARSSVQPLLDNPFDYLITDPDLFMLPMRYDASMESTGAPYLTRIDTHSSIDALAAQLKEQSNSRTIDFLSNLTTHINDQYELIVRTDGDPFPPAETLRRKSGACRDLSALFMDACRAVGLATRFVSGYQYQPETKPGECDLHAWVHVYLPGAGWRGYDPSSGLATADAHVSVATSAHPADAAPTSGTFRGSAATHTLRYQVEIENVQPSCANG